MKRQNNSASSGQVTCGKKEKREQLIGRKDLMPGYNKFLKDRKQKKGKPR